MPREHVILQLKQHFCCALKYISSVTTIQGRYVHFTILILEMKKQT